jgi:hypothetical protein
VASLTDTRTVPLPAMTTAAGSTTGLAAGPPAAPLLLPPRDDECPPSVCPIACEVAPQRASASAHTAHRVHVRMLGCNVGRACNIPDAMAEQQVDIGLEVLDKRGLELKVLVQKCAARFCTVLCQIQFFKTSPHARSSLQGAVEAVHAREDRAVAETPIEWEGTGHCCRWR